MLHVTVELQAFSILPADQHACTIACGRQACKENRLGKRLHARAMNHRMWHEVYYEA